MRGMREDMGSEVSAMTTIDVHAHFLPDPYRDALLVAGLRQADGIAQPADVGHRRGLASDGPAFD